MYNVCVLFIVTYLVKSMNSFEYFQINGVDVTSSPHEQAVALLTSAASEVTIVVYRDSPHFEQSSNHSNSQSNGKLITEPPVARMECGPVLRPPPLSVSCENGEVLGSVPIAQSLSATSSASSSLPASTQLQAVSFNSSESVTRKLTYNVGETSVAEPLMPTSAVQNTASGLSAAQVPVLMPGISPISDGHPALPTSVAPSKDSVADLFDALERSYLQAQYKPVAVKTSSTPNTEEPFPTEVLYENCDASF
jgi:hypothetical protein